MASDQRIYTDPTTAQLGERVTNLGRRQTDLEAEMRSGFKQMESSITNLANETRTALSALSQNLAERNKPQWQALGVALTFAAMLGGLAYMPIREATNDLKASVALLAEKTITRQELEWRSARAAEDRERMNEAIRTIRDDLVPRREHERVWANYDQRFADQQRQIDEAKASLGNTYSLRDYILRLNDRLDKIESRVLPP